LGAALTTYAARAAHSGRRLLRALMLGERTLAASRKFGISPGRVSQKRRESRDGWRRFCE
jgi:hypothetical protein